jgi:hypothetical protein
LMAKGTKWKLSAETPVSWSRKIVTSSQNVSVATALLAVSPRTAADSLSALSHRSGPSGSRPRSWGRVRT